MPRPSCIEAFRYCRRRPDGPPPHVAADTIRSAAPSRHYFLPLEASLRSLSFSPPYYAANISPCRHTLHHAINTHTPVCDTATIPRYAFSVVIHWYCIVFTADIDISSLISASQISSRRPVYFTPLPLVTPLPGLYFAADWLLPHPLV